MQVDAGLLCGMTNRRRRHDPAAANGSRLQRPVGAIGFRFWFWRRLGFRHRAAIIVAMGRPCGVRLEHDERGADGDDVTRLTGEFDDLARNGGGDLDGRLVGHHRADHILLVDLVADLDEPFADLGLNRAFTKVRQLEYVFAHSTSIMLRMSATRRFLPGKYCHSNACGYGVSQPAVRRIGASRL